MTPTQGRDHDHAFGMFTVDARLIVRTWDPWIADITGVAAGQALDRPVTEVLPAVDARQLTALLEDVLERGVVEVLSPALHHYLIPCAPQTPSRHFDRMQQRVSLGPVREDGRITGVLVTIEDVTARLEQERELADSAGSLGTALGQPDWAGRQREVRALARRGPAIVDSLVATLREQHRNFNVLSSALDLLAITDVDIVEPLVACLRSGDVDLQVQAALILGERQDARAIPPLMDALEDPDLNVRFHAIESLGRLRAREAVDALVRIAETREFFLAFPAIQALAQLGDANVARRLVPLLGDDMLGTAAVEAVGELGDDLVAEPLVHLLGEPHAPAESIADALTALHDRYERRYKAGEQIATIVRRAATAAATQNLIDASDRVSPDRLRGIASVLGWLAGPAVERALTRMLGKPTIRAQVVEALVRYGAGVVDLLIEQLRAEDLETREAAAVALGRIGDRRATLPLVAALDDREVALAAAAALARIGDSAAFDGLLRLIGDPDGALRQAAIAALNSIGHPEMPARILERLADPDPLVRESAVRIAGYFGYRECVDAVLALCDAQQETVRRAAVEQLAMFEDPRAGERLVRALASDTPPVRAVAASALTHADAALAVPALLRALDDRDAWVRFFVLRALAAFNHAATASAVRERLETDEAPQVRLAALDLLGRLQPPDILAVLAPLALSEDADTARAAIRAMRHLSSADVEPHLDALSRAPEGWRRLEAVGAIGTRGGAYAVAALEWIAAADEERAIADAAIDALAALAGRDRDEGKEAVRALVDLTAEPARREAAIAALARLPVSRAPLIARGLEHSSAHVRRAVVDALSCMRHSDATRWIESALDDASPSVRAAAVSELRRLGTRRAARKLVMLAQTDPDPGVRHAATVATDSHKAGA